MNELNSLSMIASSLERSTFVKVTISTTSSNFFSDIKSPIRDICCSLERYFEINDSLEDIVLDIVLPMCGVTYRPYFRFFEY